jgi:NADH:ubiquinone oxidoreductase subunit 5 (subunit L)/multisubunit Na+/H+ antiporter MnhA subunit
MSTFIPVFVILPLISFLLGLVIPAKKEKIIFWTSAVPVLMHLAFYMIFSIYWIMDGSPDLHCKGPILYKTKDSEFSIDFFYDKYSGIYLLVSAILTYLVLVFSRYYMHREKGYKRFFNNIMFFYTGLCVILFAGNLETLFIGWEIIGITSFFLIGFYRDRYLPVKNALKVVSLYRIADVLLLLGIWLCHHYFSRSISFFEINEQHRNGTALISDPAHAIIIPLIFVAIAMVKSAQFPFSFWLPRALEGPTTSSAIFYGSLSSHIGVFLLVRSFPLWDQEIWIRVLVILIGLVTSMVATLIARVQSSVKTQIAYSSIAQIGLMFIEVALGLHYLALFHFAGNAFLRTYQILVSPSVLNYLIHDQFFNYIPRQHEIDNSFWGRLKKAIYILSIREWNMDYFAYKWLWQPLKKAGGLFQFLSFRILTVLFIPVFLTGLILAYNQENIPHSVIGILPLFMISISLVLILKVFAFRGSAIQAWILTFLSQLFISLAIAFNEEFDFAQVYLYLSGILISAALGYFCLSWLKKQGEHIALNKFHGHSYEHPRLTLAFMLAILGLAGFPITPTFIGEDILLGHVHENQYLLTFLIALCLIMDGLVAFRIYSRIFLGPHEKGYHEVAYRSS